MSQFLPGSSTKVYNACNYGYNFKFWCKQIDSTLIKSVKKTIIWFSIRIWYNYWSHLKKSNRMYNYWEVKLYTKEILKIKFTGNLSFELLFHLWTHFKTLIVSLCLPWASKNFGLSGIFISKNANVILGSEHTITNRFHDLNNMYSFSNLNVWGIIIHATPEMQYYFNCMINIGSWRTFIITNYLIQINID